MNICERAPPDPLRGAWKHLRQGIAYLVATYQVVDTYENLGRERRFIHEEYPNLRPRPRSRRDVG